MPDPAEKVAEVLTCGDNSCRLEKPPGQGTNGGCRCFNGLPTANRLRILKYLHRTEARVWGEAAKVVELDKCGGPPHEGAGHGETEVCEILEKLITGYAKGFRRKAQEVKEG